MTRLELRLLVLLVLVSLMVGCKEKPAGTEDAGGPGPGVDSQPDAGTPPVEPGVPEPAGPQKAEGETKDGVKQGPWVFFHDNGKKAAEGGYRDGSKDGAWVYWYQNGQKAAEGQYLKGKKDGAWTEFNEDGSKAAERKYKDGMQVY
jgi:hypothetical protein